MGSTIYIVHCTMYIPYDLKIFCECAKIHPSSPGHCSQSVLFQQYCFFLWFPSCFSEHLCHAQLASSMFLPVHSSSKFAVPKIQNWSFSCLFWWIGLFPAFFTGGVGRPVGQRVTLWQPAAAVVAAASTAATCLQTRASQTLKTSFPHFKENFCCNLILVKRISV